MVLERLHEFIDKKGISIAAFELSTGMSNAAFRNALKYGKGIGSDKLENVLCVYADLSAEWLFRGSGEMLIGAETPTGDHIEQQGGTNNIGKIAGETSELLALRKEVEMLREQLQEKKAQCQSYWEMIKKLTSFLQ